VTSKAAVLFLCTHNAARSQMAGVLLRRHAGNRFEVFSARLQPTEVHPLTRQVLTEVGIDPTGLRAKGVQEFMGRVTRRRAGR
jgi:protein-tyrosine-phosphatase